jgi:hypothetical protein
VLLKLERKKDRQKVRKKERKREKERKKENHVMSNIQTENSSLCLIKYHAMKIHGEVQVQLHTF